MRRALVPFAALALAAGCGGVERESNLAEASKRTEATGSARFSIRASGIEVGQRVEVICDGVADYPRKRSKLSCDLGAQAEFEMVEIGDVTYVRGEGLGVKGERWQKMPTAEEDRISAFSPERLLSMLRSASRDTERIGEEDVRGQPTVRYRLIVDREEAQLSDGPGETAPVEVWVGRDGLIRRVTLEDGDMTATIEFFDFGAAVNIEAPPADEVEKIDEGTIFGSGSPGDDATSCSEGEARPIGADQAIDVLRRYGFSVRRQGQTCNPAYDATILTNSAAGSQDMLAREGFVYCTVMRMKPGGAGKMLVEVGQADADAKLRLKNLECTIFADSANPAEKVARLERAFAELRRAIRP